MFNKLLRNSDKIRTNTRMYSYKTHAVLPWFKEAHRYISPYLSERSNRIINKGFGTVEKIKDIVDIITE